ncbi:MAG: hypothetical protein AAGD14_14585 [Planctomycetota bacterium]
MRGLALLLLLAGCASQPKASWLFVQSAQRAELRGDRLHLSGLDPVVVCFTDRPARRTGTVPTERFLQAWSDGGVFAEVPPNASLAVFTGDTVREVVVVLRDPKREAGGLSYAVERLDGKGFTPGPAALFIDSVGSGTPVVRHGMHDEPGVVFRQGMHTTR